ncbi:O-antigen ligase family protein [Candidatus Pelagibacter communis]|uniref:O-antigen ligase family protein n=1 Tax=Pelagibacter ubique TaxID=198252 RepID=UPI00094CB237|nr:O-antigen ligase family protein [Candidatus Pelagibacter ubique]
MKKNDFFYNLISIFFFSFPILIIIGPLFLNLFSVVMSIYAILKINELKKLIFFKDKIFISIILIIIFIFPYNNFNLNFTELKINFDSTFFKYFSYFRYILMCFGIIIFLKIYNSNNFFLTKVKNYYFLYLVLISIDVIIELYTGSNIFGYFTYYPGRVASFTNEELIIGYIFSFIVLFSINDGILKLNKYFLLILTSLILILSFLIGERSNFIKLFSIIIFFSSFHYINFNKFHFSKSLLFIITISFITILIFGLMRNTPQAKKIYNIQIFEGNKLSLNQLYFNNKHLAHYDAAFKIFLNYPIFGVGINNFGNESKKQKYESKKFSYTNQRSSTHPHQIYFEILAEVGLFGFLYLITLNLWIAFKAFKLYLKDKNFSLLGSLMLHIFFIYPLLPSGSFFGTNYGLPYWFNLSVLIYQIYFLKKN